MRLMLLGEDMSGESQGKKIRATTRVMRELLVRGGKSLNGRDKLIDNEPPKCTDETSTFSSFRCARRVFSGILYERQSSCQYSYRTL